MKKIPWVIAIFFFFLSSYFFILLVNAGAHIDDVVSENSRLRERSLVALSVIHKVFVNKKFSEISNFLDDYDNKDIDTSTESVTYEMGEIIFKLKNGIIVDIIYID